MGNIRVIETEYKLLSYSGGYFRIQGERGIGVMNGAGKIVVEPFWQDVLISPDDGPVELFIRKRWVEQPEQTVFDFIDTEGKILSQDNCGDCVGFREGIAVVKGVLGFQCLDKDGKILFAIDGGHLKSPAWCGLFHDGMLRVPNKLGYYCHYVDRSGKKLTDDYLNAGDFHEEYAVVARERFLSLKGNAYGVIDRDGHWLVRPKYDYIDKFQNSRAVVKNKKYGAIDRHGQLRVPFVWDVLSSYGEDGLAFAKSDYPASACLIDKDGTQVLQLPMEVKYSRSFSDELLAVKTDRGWGFADRSGNWVIEAKYEEVSDFCNGTAAVMADGKWSFIDRDGKEMMTVEGGLRIDDKGLAHSEDAIYMFS